MKERERIKKVEKGGASKIRMERETWFCRQRKKIPIEEENKEVIEVIRKSDR